tara:strand:- start:63 stop:695 length:633 start_codon:yes stop_codon:yes gene_type:complete
MKKKLFKIFSAFAIISLMSFNYSPKIQSLKIGEKAPQTNLKMKAATGQDFSLEDLVMENGMLVIFSCNTCPFVIGNQSMQGWQGRYNEIYDLCKKNRIGMVLVNSNEAKRANVDSFTEMQKHSEKQKYDSPYVMDKDSKLADAFGASTTPHVFLMNKNFKLIYKGAVDDNVNSASEVKENWLKDALNAAGKNEKIIIAETRNSGCSIKRK